MEQPTRTSGTDRVVDVSKGGTRHRRPTGAPPPLPKKIGTTGVLRLLLLALVVVPGCIWLHSNPGPLDRFDAAITDAVVSLRVGWLDAPARTTRRDRLTLGLGILRLLTIAGVARFKRWRHLTMLLISAALSGLVATRASCSSRRDLVRSTSRSSDPGRGIRPPRSRWVVSRS